MPSPIFESSPPPSPIVKTSGAHSGSTEIAAYQGQVTEHDETVHNIGDLKYSNTEDEDDEALWREQVML